MNKIIATAVIALVVIVSQVLSEKCDLMKKAKEEKFKKIQEDMTAWGKPKCGEDGSKTDLTPEDLATSKKCYEEHVKPMMMKIEKDKAGEAIDNFLIGVVLAHERIHQICYDEELTKEIKKAAMKLMKPGMAAKKEMEKDCEPLEVALELTIKCLTG